MLLQKGSSGYSREIGTFTYACMMFIECLFFLIVFSGVLTGFRGFVDLLRMV